MHISQDVKEISSDAHEEIEINFPKLVVVLPIRAISQTLSTVEIKENLS